MAFSNGPITTSVCLLPNELPEGAVERFAARAAKALDAVGAEPETGWVSGRHLLETQIDEQTAYAGGYLHLSLRVTERKIPGALLRAHCRMRELAWEAENGREPGRKQRKAIREEVTEQLLPEMPPQIRGIPFVVDANDHKLYLGTPSLKMEDLFLESFRETIGFEPVPLTPETYVAVIRELEVEDLHRLVFTPTPDQACEAEGCELGRDFLTWLWFLQEEVGEVSLKKYGRFAVMIDGPLLLAATGNGAMESIVRRGSPTVSAEAKAALMVGKKLKKAKLFLRHDNGDLWSTTVDADRFVFSSLHLPEGEAMDPHAVFEERVTSLYYFQRAFYGLFDQFLDEVRVPAQAAALEKRLQEWVARRESR